MGDAANLPFWPCIGATQRCLLHMRPHDLPPAQLSKIVDNAKMYFRFATGMRRFLKNPPDFDTALAAVRGNLENRERNFLRIVEHGVYANPRSPYLALLRRAGHELEDVRRMVSDNGLENSLRMLREDGVFVSFEEFKGRVPIVRDGFSFDVSDRDFDNPRTRSYYEGQTSGSTGAGTRVAMDLDHMTAMLNQASVYTRLMGELNAPMALWFPVLPASSGLQSVLMSACLGLRVERWFTPVTSTGMSIPLRYRIATDYARGMARLFGVYTPPPEPVSIAEAGKVARWAEDSLRRNGVCMVVTYVSLAVRVALAARELGIDLTGCKFYGTGEPPTPAKVRAIESSGATWRSTYGFTEGGLVGMQCGNPVNHTDLHLFTDAWAAFQAPVDVPSSGLTVNAFSFTGLFATAPKIMINVELDDYGVLEERDCGCPLLKLGFPLHARDIYSFRKLTGEGMTLVGSTMLRVLEEVLPERYGGTALDYQLVEEEDDGGLTRLTIVVSPDVGEVDEAALIETVLDEVSRDSPGADLAHALWRDAGTFRVKRADPTWSTLGKLLSLRPAKRNAGIVELEAKR